MPLASLPAICLTLCPAVLISWLFLRHTGHVPTLDLGTLIVCLGLFHVKLTVHEEEPSSKACVDAVHHSHTQSDDRKAWIEISFCQFPFVSLWTS